MSSLTEKYIPWYPVNHLKTGIFQIRHFSHTFDGLTIRLVKQESGKDVVLVITFPGGYVINRVLNESLTSKSNNIASELYKDIIPCGPIIMVENSDYMKSLIEYETGDILDVYDLRHYKISDSEWMFDVLSQYRPSVEIFIDGKLVEISEFDSHFDLYKKKKTAENK
jgi:hypothetical protein